jgi:hypothetical protein
MVAENAIVSYVQEFDIGYQIEYSQSKFALFRSILVATMYKTKGYSNCVNLQQCNQLLTFIPSVKGETDSGGCNQKDEVQRSTKEALRCWGKGRSLSPRDNPTHRPWI